MCLRVYKTLCIESYDHRNDYNGLPPQEKDALKKLLQRYIKYILESTHFASDVLLSIYVFIILFSDTKSGFKSARPKPSLYLPEEEGEEQGASRRSKR